MLTDETQVYHRCLAESKGIFRFLEAEDMADGTRFKTPAERLAHIINTTGLRQSVFAVRVELSESHLSAVKHGKEPLTEKLAYRIQRVFMYNAQWILTGKGEPSVEQGRADETAQFLPAMPFGSPASPVAQARETRPVPMTIYQCGVCRFPAAPNVPHCPYCGARIKWAHG